MSYARVRNVELSVGTSSISYSTSGPLSAILKFGSRRTSDDVISVTNESGMVENVVVAVRISLLSYSVMEIQSIPEY